MPHSQPSNAHFESCKFVYRDNKRFDLSYKVVLGSQDKFKEDIKKVLADWQSLGGDKAIVDFSPDTPAQGSVSFTAKFRLNDNNAEFMKTTQCGLVTKLANNGFAPKSLYDIMKNSSPGPQPLQSDGNNVTIPPPRIP